MNLPNAPTAPIDSTSPLQRPPRAASAASLTLVSLLALSLSACGGGGGSSDAATPAPVPAPAPSPAVVAPAITVQPADQTVSTGTSAAFSVTASGTSPAYQWQSSPDGTTWSNIAGATAATLTLNGSGSGVAAADNGLRYRVIVSNSAASVTSASATLKVLTPVATGAPSIATQPADASVTAPAAIAFTISVGGSPAPTIQWQKSTDGGTSFVAVTGATSATLSLASTTVADNASQYRAVVTNSVGTTTSRAATLNVSAAAVAPAIVNQPGAANVTAPASATFSVVASGTPAPTFQWQLSTDAGSTFVDIAGATAATYNTPATSAAASGQRYRVRVTNSQASVTSNAVTLTVVAPPAVVGSASACTSAQAYTAGYASTVIYDNSSSSGTSQTTTTTVVNGIGAFHGQRATVVEAASTYAVMGSTSTSFTSNSKTYLAYDAGTAVVTQYGVHRTTTFPVPGGNNVVDDDGVNNPAVVNTQYQLNPGGSTTVTANVTVTSTVTTPSAAGTPTTYPATTTTTNVSFVGLETLVLPFGSPQTCKFVSTDSNNEQTFTWQLLGSGVVVQTTTGALNSKARSVTINGVAL